VFSRLYSSSWRDLPSIHWGCCQFRICALLFTLSVFYFGRGDYSKKDFSGCIANDAVFSDSTLRGARFFKSSLKGADFSGADLSSVSMEESDLSDVNFHGAVLEAAYFTGATLDLAKDIEDADFTDAIMRETMQRTLCARPDAKGTNPKTGIDTRDSLMCP